MDFKTGCMEHGETGDGRTSEGPVTNPAQIVTEVCSSIKQDGCLL